MPRKLMGVLATAVVSAAAWGGPALAQGRSEPWQVNLQEAFSPVMEEIHDFHNLLLVVQFAIIVLVLGLLAYIIYKFRASRNATPSKTSHNTLLEVIWTAVPIVILVIIAIPSLRLLYFSDRIPDADMTLKVTGHQWYWSYAYPDHGNFEYDSLMIPDEDIDPDAGQVRLLSVDEEVVLPVNTRVRVLITSDDVIHNWAVPSLGLKTDAVPGRVNETWVEITQEGTYFGMCSELCGVNHGFMPIEVRAVSQDAFAEWVKEAREEFAARETPAVSVATGPDEAAR